MKQSQINFQILGWAASPGSKFGLGTSKQERMEALILSRSRFKISVIFPQRKTKKKIDEHTRVLRTTTKVTFSRLSHWLEIFIFLKTYMAFLFTCFK